MKKLKRTGYNTYNYEFRRVSLFSYLKNMFKSFLIIYIIIFIIFFLLEKGITMVSLTVPLLPASLVLLSFFTVVIGSLLSAPLRISLLSSSINCEFSNKNSFYINTSDILYVKNHISHTKRSGNYYNDKYSIFLKDGEKLTINCSLFSKSDVYAIDSLLMDTTNSYNENYIKHLQKNSGYFSKKYTESEYTFYISGYKIGIILGIFSFVLCVFLFVKQIFLFGLIAFGISAAIIFSPSKVILNIKNRQIILKNIFNLTVSDILSSETKKLIINNKFYVSASAEQLNNNNKKLKTFKLSSYKEKDKKSINEILHLIFENKIKFDLNGKEPL